LMNHGILHNPLSHPRAAERIIQDFAENWKSFLDSR